jgi:LPS sulfotransferase NodH
MKDRFIIVFVGHTGSSWLCDVLSRQPGLGYLPTEPLSKICMVLGRDTPEHVEYFRNFLFHGPIEAMVKTHAAFGVPVSQENIDKLRAARSLFFKARFDEFPRSPDGLAWVKECQTPLIRLSRRNKVKHAISHIKRNDMNLGHFKFKEILPPIHIDPQFLADRVKVLAEREQKSDLLIAHVGVPTLKISYEDLMADIDTSVRKILDFIQLPYTASELVLESLYKKVTHDDLRHALSNYDEVRSYFKNTTHISDFD